MRHRHHRLTCRRVSGPAVAEEVSAVLAAVVVVESLFVAAVAVWMTNCCCDAVWHNREAEKTNLPLLYHCNTLLDVAAVARNLVPQCWRLEPCLNSLQSMMRDKNLRLLTQLGSCRPLSFIGCSSNLLRVVDEERSPSTDLNSGTDNDRDLVAKKKCAGVVESPMSRS